MPPGSSTIEDLATAVAAPTGMNPDTFAMLRTQARLQLESPAGTPALHPPAPADADESVAPAAPPVPTYQVVAPTALGALPRPDHGDLFFDFEGDPLYTEPVPPGREEAAQWGIDYLFGWVDDREQYTALWAHSFADEKRALESFLDIVNLRRMQHPDMHIYHYAPYEPTHLLAMAARHGVREGDVDRLLRDGVFVDLYPIVRRALRVGSRSYSIKKLEPLYMGDEVRTSDVQKGDDSIVRYVEARALGDDGQDQAAREIFDDLADYNRYDCVSTRRLRDWLVDRAREAGLRPSLNPEPGEGAYEPSVRALTLSSLAQKLPEDSVEAQSLRLGAAAIDYYPREAKTFWATHFLRLREPVSVWEETRDVAVVDAARCRVAVDWHFLESGRGGERRILELRGELAPGTRLTEGSGPFALYELPAPYPFEASPRWIHSYRSVKVVEVLDDGALVEETAVDGVTWSELPIALTPEPPPRALKQQDAIDAWADAVIAAAPDAAGGPGDRHPEPASASDPSTGSGAGWRPAGIGGRRHRRHRARDHRSRPQLPRRAGSPRHRQDVCRIPRDRASGEGAGLQGRRRRPVARGHREHARPGGRGRGSARAGGEGAEGSRRRRDCRSPRSRRTASRRSPRNGPRGTSSAAPPGTSATMAGSRAAASICSSSTRPASSRWRRRSPCRWRRRGCCCSATRSSCRR